MQSDRGMPIGTAPIGEIQYGIPRLKLRNQNLYIDGIFKLCTKQQKVNVIGKELVGNAFPWYIRNKVITGAVV